MIEKADLLQEVKDNINRINWLLKELYAIDVLVDVRVVNEILFDGFVEQLTWQDYEIK